jgi:hypothetical protein
MGRRGSVLRMGAWVDSCISTKTVLNLPLASPIFDSVGLLRSGCRVLHDIPSFLRLLLDRHSVCQHQAVRLLLGYFSRRIFFR